MTEKELALLSLETDRVRESLARVVAAADSERRAIERDLHDGVQQHLVALAVNVQLARQVVNSDRENAVALLDEIARDVREALESVRTLAGRIFPPLLVDRGLVEALASAASASDIHVRFDAAGLPRYPDDVEATVYFSCVETLRNATVDAVTGSTATMRVWEEQNELRFEVTYLSGSEPPPPVREVTLPLVDRVGALGGTLTASSDPDGGQRVAGAIPTRR